jgi:hypothetical protein
VRPGLFFCLPLLCAAISKKLLLSITNSTPPTIFAAAIIQQPTGARLFVVPSKKNGKLVRLYTNQIKPNLTWS